MAIRKVWQFTRNCISLESMISLGEDGRTSYEIPDNRSDPLNILIELEETHINNIDIHNSLLEKFDD